MAHSLDDVITQMQQVGIDLPPTADLAKAFDGFFRWRPSCEKASRKSAWARLFEYVSPNGRRYISGTFGWRGDKWDVEASSSDWTPADRAEYMANRRAAQRVEQEHRARDGEKAAEKAEKLWARAREEGANAYLDRKKVRAFGVRFLRDMLLVPLRDVSNALRGLQYIGEDKKFGSGTVKEGHFHLIGTVEAGRPLAFAEGYATGASVHMATGWPVVVCFDAGNLEPVVATWRKLYPELEFVLAADDDRHLVVRLCERLKRLGIAATPAELGKLDEEHDWVVPGGGTDGGDLVIVLKAGWTKDSSGVPSITGSLAAGDVVHMLRLENAGRSRAEAAARRHKARVFLPRFKDAGSSATDWNDLHVTEGLDVVREQLESAVGTKPATQTPASSKRSRGGADRAAPGGDNAATEFMQRFTLIYGTTLVWDEKLRQLLKIESLKLAHEGLTKWWLAQEDRKMVPQANVVFDPTGEAKAPDYVNLFDRLPLDPVQGGECDLIVEHLHNLCGKRDELTHWLTCWLALPLQKPGTKMRTAIVLHGRTEGTGKSRLMDVMRMIYGSYSRSVTQLQLQSEFTGWLSGMLFIVAEEVVNAQDRAHHQGLLQNLITTPVVQINEKNMPVREEKSYANMGFLSNQTLPVKLNPSDRRYTVIHVEAEQDEAYFNALSEQIRNGGAAAFYDYLLNYDLRGFTAFTRPHKNKDRLHLITLSMTSDQRFFEFWRTGLSGLPFCTCAAKDLFRGYTAWCKVNGERFTSNSTVFGRMVSDELQRLDAPAKKVVRYTAWSDKQVEDGDFGNEVQTSAQQALVYFVVQPRRDADDDAPEAGGAPEASPESAEPFGLAERSADIRRFQKELHALVRQARRGL